MCKQGGGIKTFYFRIAKLFERHFKHFKNFPHFLQFCTVVN